MRLRRWISIFAMLGVLLHAGALVRHHGVMLGALLQYDALVSDLAAFCHSGADGASHSPVDLPSIPKPSDAKNGCPICSGHSPAFAVVAPALLELRVPASAAACWHCLDFLRRDAQSRGVSPSPRPPGARLSSSKLWRCAVRTECIAPAGGIPCLLSCRRVRVRFRAAFACRSRPLPACPSSPSPPYAKARMRSRQANPCRLSLWKRPKQKAPPKKATPKAASAGPKSAPAPVQPAALDPAATPPGGSLTVPTTTQAEAILARVPGSVVVVPDTAYKYTTPALTIKDVLDYVPGVFAQPKWGEDTRLSIRGSGLSRNFHLRSVELFMDGIPINTADGYGDFQEIDPTRLPLRRGLQGRQRAAIRRRLARRRHQLRHARRVATQACSAPAPTSAASAFIACSRARAA